METQALWVNVATMEIFFVKPTDQETVEMEFPLEFFREGPDPMLPGRRFLNEDGTCRVEVAPDITRKRTIEETLDGAIADLEAAQTLLASRAPTAAETRQILRLLVRCVLGVVRLLRNRV